MYDYNYMFYVQNAMVGGCSLFLFGCVLPRRVYQLQTYQFTSKAENHLNSADRKEPYATRPITSRKQSNSEVCIDFCFGPFSCTVFCTPSTN